MRSKRSVPKGRKTREVPIDDRIADWLRNWRATSGGDGLVFPATGGKHLDAKNMCKRKWRPALFDSGIWDEVAASGHPAFRFHDLRHVYASLLLNNGASLHDVQRAMGHASYTTTEKSYAHLEKGYFDKLRARTGELTTGITLDAGPSLRAVN